MTHVPDTIKRGRLSADEEGEIIELAERKLGAGQIALRLNRHPATVNFAMHRLGLRVIDASQAGREYVRGGVVVRRFTAEDDAFITALRIQRFTTPQIAALLAKRTGHPRTAATISMRLTMLSNVEEAA